MPNKMDLSIIHSLNTNLRMNVINLKQKENYWKTLKTSFSLSKFFLSDSCHSIRSGEDNLCNPLWEEKIYTESENRLLITASVWLNPLEWCEINSNKTKYERVRVCLEYWMCQDARGKCVKSKDHLSWVLSFLIFSQWNFCAHLCINKCECEWNEAITNTQDHWQILA